MLRILRWDMLWYWKAIWIVQLVYGFISIAEWEHELPVLSHETRYRVDIQKITTPALVRLPP